MCISAIIAGVSLLSSVVGGLAGSKSSPDPVAPAVPQLPEQPKLQNEKRAQTEVSKATQRDRLRKSKTSASLNPTLLTGASGVNDDTLSLGRTLLN